MQAHCGDQTTNRLDEMLCSSLILHGLAELAISVSLFVHHRGACAISGVIIFEDTLLCSGHVRKRFLLVSLRLAKCAPWRSCCCCAMYIIAHLLKLIVVAAVDVFAEELVELMAESLDLLFEL